MKTNIKMEMLLEDLNLYFINENVKKINATFTEMNNLIVNAFRVGEIDQKTYNEAIDFYVGYMAVIRKEVLQWS